MHHGHFDFRIPVIVAENMHVDTSIRISISYARISYILWVQLIAFCSALSFSNSTPLPISGLHTMANFNLVEAIDAVLGAARTVNDIRPLIEAHRDQVNITNAAGWTVMRLVTSLKDDHFASESVKLLLELGGDQTIAARKGLMCPIHTAAKEGKVKTVKVLAGAPGGVDLRTAAGLTALHYAAEVGNLLMTTELVGLGFDIHMVTNQGNTPAHYAGVVGAMDVMKYLIEEGSDTHLENDLGYTCYGKYFTRHTNTKNELESIAFSAALQDAVHPVEHVMAIFPGRDHQAAQELLDEMSEQRPAEWSDDSIWYYEICRCRERGRQ